MFISEKRTRGVMRILFGHQFLPKETKYLSEQFLGRLATSVNDEPHVTPVRYAFESGRIYINIAVNSKKMRNILRNNRVAFVVDDYLEKGGVKRARGVYVKGEAEIHESGEIYEFGIKLIRVKYESAKGFQRGPNENRAIILIKPKKVLSWGL
jgi:nitroimidazol reductase NimA-like FMN-containing flavoprotein (pyridoxamine 5'-phosphate oxidase superfamily)